MRQFLTNSQNRNFLLLWMAQLISQFGDRINQMALIGLIAGRSSSSALDLAKLLSFTIIPVFIIGPVAGVYVDRWDRRTTLFVCDFLRGFLVLLIPLALIHQGNILYIYGVVFLTFCLSRFYVPAKMSIIPDLVDEKDLLVANSLVSVTGMIAFVLGCAVGGWIVEKSGAMGGFFWDAITFFVSGILVFIIKPRFNLHLNKKKIFNQSKELVQNIRKSIFEEVRDGIVYIRHHQEIRFILNILFVLLAAAGSIYVVIIVFVQQAFNSVTKDLGVLAVFLGLGLFCGAVGFGRYGQKMSPYRVIFSCLTLGGLMLIAFSVGVSRTQSLFLAMGLAFLLGLIVGPIIIAANTVAHQVSSDAMRGKVFSGMEMVIHFAFLVSMLMSSWLSKYVMPFWILVFVGGVFSVVGLVGLVRLRFKQKG